MTPPRSHRTPAALYFSLCTCVSLLACSGSRSPSKAPSTASPTVASEKQCEPCSREAEASASGASEHLAPFTVVQGMEEGLPYLEALVGDVKPQEKLPMIIAIHGLGYRPRVPEDPFLELGRKMRVIFPSGPERYRNGGFSWMSVRVRDKKPDELGKALKERAQLLSRFIEKVTQVHPTQGKPIVLGFSQGGMLTWTLSLYHPSQMSTAFPLAGWLPPTIVPSAIGDKKGYPIIRSMHAKDDKVIPVGPTRSMVEGLQAKGLQLEFREFEQAGHRMSDEMKGVFATWLKEALDKVRLDSR